MISGFGGITLKRRYLLRIVEQTEPADFDARVRQPGRAFLATIPRGESVDFSNKNYWGRCRQQLREAYSAICAYSGLYIEEVTGSETVEHFLPKNDHRDEAYEWSNYRYVSGRLNGRKGKREILDPFEIPKLLFYLDIPSSLVLVNEQHADDYGIMADQTIEILGLNDERCTRSRFHWIYDYANGDVSLSYVRRHAPFVYREVARQGLTVQSLKVRLGIA